MAMTLPRSGLLRRSISRFRIAAGRRRVRARQLLLRNLERGVWMRMPSYRVGNSTACRAPKGDFGVRF
jgi:hypothetical protein